MKTLVDYQQDPFFIFAFPEYREDACYIMLAESAIESLEKAKDSVKLRKDKNGYEFRAVGTSDYESLKGGAYEYTPWIPLEKLVDAAEKTAQVAAAKENFQSE
jgi:hypothetical protein